MAQSSPDIPSSKHNVASKKISLSQERLTPPDSPTKGTATSQTIGLIVAAKPAQSCPASNKREEGVQVADGLDLDSTICTTPDDFKSFEKWASTPQFKTVVETWDKEACKYKIAEPVEGRSVLGDYAEYAFIVRKRVDRTSKEVTTYIDVKSQGLRDTLRVLLDDVKAISLEDKPSIEQNVLFHFLPELNRCSENIDNGSDHDLAHADHFRLLISHLREAYASISQRLRSILQRGHITYDLLWALFKPGCHVYITCIGTKEPQCVKFEAVEEITQNDKTWLNLECRFLDYDGVEFGEAGIFLRVPKFRGSKLIETLEAYPLRHHPSYGQVREDLVEGGQNLQDWTGSHIQHRTDRPFPMNEGEVMEPPTENHHYLDLDTGAMVPLRCNEHSASYDPLSYFGCDQLLNVDPGSMESSPTPGSPCSFPKVLAIEEIQYLDLDTGEMNTQFVAFAH